MAPGNDVCIGARSIENSDLLGLSLLVPSTHLGSCIIQVSRVRAPQATPPVERQASIPDRDACAKRRRLGSPAAHPVEKKSRQLANEVARVNQLLEVIPA